MITPLFSIFLVHYLRNAVPVRGRKPYSLLLMISLDSEYLRNAVPVRGRKQYTDREAMGLRMLRI